MANEVSTHALRSVLLYVAKLVEGRPYPSCVPLHTNLVEEVVDEVHHVVHHKPDRHDQLCSWGRTV